MISLQKFQDMVECSAEVAELWHPAVVAAMDRWEINTPKRIAAFLAQTSHESGGYRRFQENLNYSAQQLADTWPTRFAVEPKARPRQPNPLAWAMNRQPEVIANTVYANRYGNGDAASGDGWDFRGRGPIQITFLDNYRDCGNAIGVDLLRSPELLTTPGPGAMSAGWYWSTRGCNERADADDFVGVTKAINPGLIGQIDREARLARINDIFGTDPGPTMAQLLSDPPPTA